MTTTCHCLKKLRVRNLVWLNGRCMGLGELRYWTLLPHFHCSSIFNSFCLSSLPIWITINSKLFEAETISIHSVQLQIIVLTLLHIYTKDFPFQRYTGGYSRACFQKRNILHINTLVNHVQLIQQLKKPEKMLMPRTPIFILQLSLKSCSKTNSENQMDRQNFIC